MMFRSFLFAMALVAATAFNSFPRICRPTKTSVMMVVFDKPSKQKQQPKPQPQQEYRINQGMANRGVYAPDGFTREQYEEILKKEEEAKEKHKKLFPIGTLNHPLIKSSQTSSH